MKRWKVGAFQIIYLRTFPIYSDCYDLMNDHDSWKNIGKNKKMNSLDKKTRNLILNKTDDSTNILKFHICEDLWFICVH